MMAMFIFLLSARETRPKLVNRLHVELSQVDVDWHVEIWETSTTLAKVRVQDG